MELRCQEEALWKSKSRVTWLTSPNLSTLFLHLSTVIRRRWNCIQTLKTEYGNWISGQQAVGDHMVSYFQNLFSASALVGLEELEHLIPRLVTDEDNGMLCALPDDGVIWATVHNLGATKALGPNGMTGLFYQTYWPTVCLDVICVVHHFFQSGFLMKKT